MIKQKIAGQSAFDFEKMREIWIDLNIFHFENEVNRREIN